MKELYKTRDTKRKLLTRYCKTIKETLDILPPVGLNTLKRHLSEVTKRAQQVSDAHTDLTHAADADVSINVEELIAEQDSWLEREMLIVDQLNDQIDQIQTSRPKSPTPDPREGSSTESLIDNQLTRNNDRTAFRSGIKLSQLELATFDGINISRN